MNAAADSSQAPGNVTNLHSIINLLYKTRSFGSVPNGSFLCSMYFKVFLDSHRMGWSKKFEFVLWYLSFWYRYDLIGHFWPVLAIKYPMLRNCLLKIFWSLNKMFSERKKKSIIFTNVLTNHNERFFCIVIHCSVFWKNNLIG